MLQTYIEKRLQTDRKNLAGRKNVTDRQTEKKRRGYRCLFVGHIFTLRNMVIERQKKAREKSRIEWPLIAWSHNLSLYIIDNKEKCFLVFKKPLGIFYGNENKVILRSGVCFQCVLQPMQAANCTVHFTAMLNCKLPLTAKDKESDVWPKTMTKNGWKNTIRSFLVRIALFLGSVSYTSRL